MTVSSWASAWGFPLFAVLGLLFGSLAGALSFRLPRGLPVAADRSRCPSCGTQLTAFELVPLASWILLRARCRHCRVSIGWRYPLIELATAGLFVAAWMKGGGDVALAALLALSGFALVVIAVADLESGIIPDAMVVLLGFAALAMRGVAVGQWTDGALGSVIAFGLAFGLRAAFKALRGYHGLGLGDVKFLAVAGLVVGLGSLGVYLVEAGVIGLLLGMVWRWSGRGKVFPFGPALCAALLFRLYFAYAPG